MSMFIGLDLGTSSLKAVVLSADHEVKATAEAGLTVSRPQPNWSEQDPRQWIDALHQVFDAFANQVDLSQIERIGLSGQMHGATLVGKDGKVLRPCILWNDGRAEKESNYLSAYGDKLLNISGNLPMPGFTAPKLLWLKEHEPDIFSKTFKVLLPKDFLRYYLTGEFVSDPSDSSGTLWMNPSTRNWDTTLLSMGDMDIEQMPSIVESNEVTGNVLPKVAQLLGIRSIEVVAGGGDNACGALGLSVMNNGSSFISLGSSGVLFYASDKHLPYPEKTVHAFAHAYPNTWHQMTVTLSAAGSLTWLSSIVGMPVNELLKKLQEHQKNQTDVIFLPYLNGERSPHNNPNARGVFFNLTSNTSELDLCLAVLEGVAFSFCDGRDALLAAGATLHQNYVIGGGSRSALWLEILADTLDMPIASIASAENSAGIGAARLAMTDQQLAYPKPVIKSVLEPNNERLDYYSEKLSHYRLLYSSLENMFSPN